LSFLCILVLSMIVSHSPGEAGSAELPPVKVPEFVREDLPNGMTLLVAEHREQPVVFFQMLVRVGRLHDPKGKEGLCDVLADMLQEGTEHYDSSELAQALDRLAGRFGASAGPETIWLTCQVLSRKADEALRLLAEVARRPTFPKSVLRRVKQQHRAALRASYSSPDFVASRHFLAATYGPDLPQGRLVTEATIGRIRRADLEAFYDRHFNASNAVLAVIGDCDRAQMLEGLKAHFADWHAGEPTPLVALLKTFQYRPSRRLVAKKKLSQVSIVLGGRGCSVKSPRHDEFGLANHILGASGFSSRLMNAVRSEKGKTYGIHSTNVATSSSGTFMVQTFTRNDNAKETASLIREVLEDALREGLTEDELAKAKTAMIGQFPLRFENPSAWSRSALRDLFYGRGLDYTPNSRERIAGIELEQANEALRQVLDLDAMSLVIVGDPAALAGQLGGLGAFEVRKEKGDWY